MERALKAFLHLAAITSKTAECIHFAAHPGELPPGKPLLGFLMAGPYGHRMTDNGRGAAGMAYAHSFYDHMVKPLLPQLRVELMISSEPDDSSAWEAWCQPFISTIAVRIATGAPLPKRRETRFSHVLCHNNCEKLWLQYGHLHNSFELLKQREGQAGCHEGQAGYHVHREGQAGCRERFDYIVKARQDVMYKPDNFMKPEWLFKMAQNTVAVPSTEFHTRDRWMERTPSMWPLGMNDQIVFGPRSAMDAYLNIIWSNQTLPSGYPQGPESILARYMISCNLTVVTVELQISQPGGGDGHFKNGKRRRWVTTPCELCMDA
jgi:hypothetical protein